MPVPRRRDPPRLAGPFRPSLAGSELEKLRGGLAEALPAVDIAEQAHALAVIREAVRSGLVAAAHDVAEGGVAVALAEMAIPNRIGVSARVPAAGEEALFGEAPGGVILACAPSDFESLAAFCGEIPFARIGESGGSHVRVETAAASLSLQVEEAAKAYEDAIPSTFE